MTSEDIKIKNIIQKDLLNHIQKTSWKMCILYCCTFINYCNTPFPIWFPSNKCTFHPTSLTARDPITITFAPYNTYTSFSFLTQIPAFIGTFHDKISSIIYIIVFIIDTILINCFI